MNTCTEYRRIRAKFPTMLASAALFSARTRKAWSDIDGVLVRLRCEPDEFADFDDLCGDTYSHEANPDISRERLDREREEFRALVERDGVWGIIGEYRLNEDLEWVQVDSCWGFAGYSDPTDPDENGYVDDICSATLAELADAQERAEFAGPVCAAD